jgi:hypothetical protein
MNFKRPSQKNSKIFHENVLRPGCKQAASGNSAANVLNSKVHVSLTL